MDEAVAIDHLEALAHKLGVPVRYERLDSETAFPSGGLCRVRDKHFIIVNATAAPAEKLRTLAAALRRFDLSGIYVKPAVRELLEETGDWGDEKG
ncbi:conserved hypothetical protein [uncultured Desulfobacterium sp.]|uniref:Uncharacterized protein n=1 Tax=uncultured Desulfobacterium sp. TaxID=201089 RepID=A0A445MQW4_9BACT|nr:conserved hypothetical protein [uncultured Desulfobacterium sp.]